MGSSYKPTAAHIFVLFDFETINTIPAQIINALNTMLYILLGMTSRNYWFPYLFKVG